jgi:PAS domain S-box-containing protein
MLQSLLAGNGYAVVTARNGKEALALAGVSAPDLIISDILMPIMDGFTLCRQWKQDPKLREVPFVFYSATYTDQEDKQLAFTAGADLFIVKPSETQDFLALIAEALERYGARERRSAPADLPGEPTYLKEYNDVLIHKLEHKLTQLEDANRALAIKEFAIESSISGIVMTDPSGILTYVNISFTHMWGYNKHELSGRHLAQLVSDPSALPFLSREFPEQAGWLGEAEARRKNGTTFTALIAAHPIMARAEKKIGIMVSCIDITERKRMQEELQRIQKLELLRVFAGGIAHDFNNLLTGIFGSIQLARQELPDASAPAIHLDKATGVFERAKDLTQRLLTYTKGKTTGMGAVEIDAILRECCALSLSGANIQCRTKLADGLWTVRADANQLAQVLNNIIINARQAMKNGGRLEISAQNHSLEANQVGRLPAGKYVAVAIKDEGGGIPENVITRIFDPFFTTKTGGSGLGLTTSLAIIHEHGGHIGVASSAGAGSTFTVWLPACFGKKTSMPAESSPDVVQGVGRILIMDDEEVIRDLAGAMLRSGGYETVAVGNGEEALEAYRNAASSGRSFAAVLLDLTIRGGMGGLETASELLKIDPNAAIVMSSGYSNDATMSELVAPGHITLIPKPYLLHEILAAVRKAVTRGGKDMSMIFDRRTIE